MLHLVGDGVETPAQDFQCDRVDACRSVHAMVSISWGLR
jgi:hypothetical protein